jgi:DNA-directed RNA polymerase subunit RPC12/RpoP
MKCQLCDVSGADALCAEHAIAAQEPDRAGNGIRCERCGRRVLIVFKQARITVAVKIEEAA